MKTITREVLASIGMAAVLPGLLAAAAAGLALREPEAVPEEAEPTPAAETSSLPPVPVLLGDGTVAELALPDYLTGVVLAEMPADFEPEALKAQAVVSATYALRRVEGASRHGSAAVCTNAACCQGYTPPGDYLAAGGSDEAVEKVRAAVDAVAGQVLTYDGELIEATFFSASGGSTEDAVAVWGSDLPYLRATPSPGEVSAHNTRTYPFSGEEFAAALGIAPEGTPDCWLGPVSYTAGDGVETMVIGGETFTGTELRRLLGLPSTDLEISVQGDTVTVVTHGYGHRVGMSQYGAQAMALAGSSYGEILSHYYQGTALTQYAG